MNWRIACVGLLTVFTAFRCMAINMFKWIKGKRHYICRIWHHPYWSVWSSRCMSSLYHVKPCQTMSMFVCRNVRCIMQHWRKGKQSALTLQLDSWPSPPAHTIFSVTRVLHQSGLLQVAWLTTGSRACCRISAAGPPAGKKRANERQTNM